VKVVVFNNGALGFIELEQKSTGFLPTGTELQNPNFAAMAEAVGVRGIRLEDRPRSKPESLRLWLMMVRFSSMRREPNRACHAPAVTVEMAKASRFTW